MKRAFLMGVGVVAGARGWLACFSPSPGREGASGDAGRDAAVTAAIEAGPSPEAAAGDDDTGSPFGDGPGGCVPGDVSAYVPSWHPPAQPRASCTEAELDDLVADCFEAISTSVACDAFQARSQGCWSCMVTPDTSNAWGPIVASSYTELYYGNFAGCIALRTGDQSATGCGPLQQAARLCSELACSGGACPTQSPREVAAVVQCTSDALDGDCAPYQSAAVSCAEGLLTAGGASAAAEQFCNAGTYGDLGTYYRALGPLFCGAQPDGGTDSGVDGAPDGGGAGD
jgi:hypothetical protein